MWQLIAFALCMIVLALCVKRISEKRKRPPETFVCSQCGEKHCICHRKEDA